MQTPPLPPDAEKPDDNLLEDLAGLTGLFNPEIIWQEEEQLEKIGKQQDQEASAQD